jgi:hypothetical protein
MINIGRRTDAAGQHQGRNETQQDRRAKNNDALSHLHELLRRLTPSSLDGMISVFVLIQVAQPGECRFERGTIRDREDFGSLTDSANKTGKYFARSKFQEQIASESINHVLDALSPSDGPCNLLCEALQDIAFSPYRLGRDVGDNFCRRIRNRDRREISSQFDFCGHHQPGMKRSRDIQRNGSPYTMLLGEIDRFSDFFDFSGQNNLAGTVHVCYIDVCLSSDLSDIDFVTPDKRSHRSAGSVTSLFHVSPPVCHQLKAGQEIECTGRGVCGEFSE